MKYVKTVGKYEIFEASKAECEEGYKSIKWGYPCFCVFYEFDPSPRIIRMSDARFDTLEKAEFCCREDLI